MENPEGISKTWTDKYGTLFGQDAGSGQIYRLSEKGKKVSLAHVPPIIDVDAVVTPIEEPAPAPIEPAPAAEPQNETTNIPSQV